jgi:hypothetical protein
MDFFEAENFKDLVNNCVPSLNERGIFAKIAKYLNVTNVYINQIFKGDKHLSFEQGALVAEFFGFTPLQTQYFMHLLGLEKAGHFKLISYHKNQLSQIRQQSKKIASRVKNSQTMSLENQAIFYSDWRYAAFQIACALPNINSVANLVETFRVSEKEATRILNFLLENGLVISEKDHLRMGLSHSHLDKDSPLISSHHKNWRVFASERSAHIDNDELMYTAPMVISRKLSKEFRASLLQLIQEFVMKTEGCPDEDLRVLTIDFLRLV